METLRVVIVADDPASFQNWEFRLFDMLSADARFNIVCLALPKGGVRTIASGIAKRLFTQISLVEARVYPTAKSEDGDAFRAALAATPIIEFEGKDPVNAEDFKRTLSEIAALRPDLVLQHGYPDLARVLAGKATFGAWTLGHASGGEVFDGMAGFWEAYDKSPTTPAWLFSISTERERDTVLATARFNTEPIPSRNRLFLGEKSVSFVWRHLCTLAETRSPFQVSNEKAPDCRDRQLTLMNSLGFAVRTISLLRFTLVGRLRRKAGQRRNRWTLFSGRLPLSADSLSQAFEWRPPRGEFWADPFLLQRDGETFVFFENYVYADGRAKISVGRIAENGLDVLGDALVLPYHLSFPYIFEHDGDLFMVPEASESRRVSVWRCVNFPLEWELHSEALKGESVADTVMFEEKGEWWMFTNVSDGPIEDHCNELHVFSIDGPALRKVEPHPQNPVLIDSRVARNAGRIERREGRLIRPSQRNAHGTYGWGLNLMEITRLDMENYEEQPVAVFEPGLLGVDGCHHVDIAGDIFVVDAVRKWD